jgi:hypothetical protein
MPDGAAVDRQLGNVPASDRLAPNGYILVTGAGIASWSVTSGVPDSVLRRDDDQQGRRDNAKLQHYVFLAHRVHTETGMA